MPVRRITKIDIELCRTEPRILFVFLGLCLCRARKDMAALPEWLHASDVLDAVRMGHISKSPDARCSCHLMPLL
jgi:hypothetical protein